MHCWGRTTQADMTLHRVDGRGEERARLDDQNTLKDDHNKVTCTPLLACSSLITRQSVSREVGGVVSWVGLTRVSLPVQGLQAADIVLEHLLGPPGVSHGLPWRPGLHSQGGRGQGPHNCGPPSEDISVRVRTSKELTCNKQWKEELGGITASDKWLNYTPPELMRGSKYLHSYCQGGVIL